MNRGRNIRSAYALFVSVVLIFLLSFATQHSLAQVIELDSVFSANEYLTGGTIAPHTSILLQSDGKIITVEAGKLVRRNTDGSLDLTFHFPAGLTAGSSSGTTPLGIQSDGKIVSMVSGLPNADIARFNTDGSLDNTFNAQIGLGDVRALTVQSNGGILAIPNGGALYRFHPNGVLDTAFTYTTTTDEFGNIVSMTPRMVGGLAGRLIALPNGKILVGGSYGMNYEGAPTGGLFRVNADGSLDATFSVGLGFSGGTGYGLQSMALNPNGNIYAAGDFTSFQGVQTNNIASVKPDGSIDMTFQATNGVGLDNFAWCIESQPDGKVLIGGAFNSYNGYNSPKIVRLQQDGSVDSAWSIGDGFNGRIFAITVQPDGKILTGGEFTSYNGSNANYLARFNTTLESVSAHAVYSTTSFVEAPTNNGTILTQSFITLTNDIFLPNGAFVQGTHFNVTGVPAGLTLNVTKISPTQAQLSFTGNATTHNNINDTSVTLTFLNAAVASGNAAGATGLTPQTLTINFNDNPSASYSGISFVESAANDGTVSTTRTISLSASQWDNAIANGTSLISGTHFTASNIPSGLTAVVTKISATQATISFTGNAASHTELYNVNNVQLTFMDAALNGNAASAVQGLNGVNLSIVFIGKECNAVTTFAGNGASASVDGTGVAASFIDPLAVAADKSGNVFVTDGGTVRKITPNGVVSTFAQAGGNGIAIDGSGTIFTIEQTKINKITPAGVVTTVPTSGLTLSNGSDIAVDAFGNLFVSDGLNSIYKIAPTGVATKLNNQPVIAAGIAVDPLGNVYAGGYNTNKVYKIAPNGNLTTIAGTGQAGYADGVGTSAQFNQPVGLTLDASGNIYVMDYVGSRIRKITPGGVVSTIAGSGNVGYADGVGTSASFNYPLHIALDTTGNLFVTDRLNYRIRSINVCGASGALSGAAVYLGTGFQESTTNNGSIAATTSTIVLGSVTWASSIANGTALTAGTHFTASNVPAGLTAVVTKVSASQATISFTGNAANHLSTNNVNNVQLTFADAALNGVSASSVQGLNGVNLSISYLNPGSAIYSGTVFPEAAANDGTITTTRTITLFNEQWSSAIGIGTVLVNGSHYSAAGVPAGLLMSITKISGTAATISFTGTALAHQNANDALVTLTFTPQALASLTPSNQVGGLNKTLTIDFNDNPSASYSGTTFLEALPANNGTIATVRTITLFAAQWTSTVANGSVLTAGTHYIASNVPAGLTAVITKISSTGATLSFTGNAVAHQSANSVSNVQITFFNAALSSLATSSVAGLNGVNLSVNFSDNAVASYSGTTFSEASANDGTVSTTRTVTLAFDTFVPTGVFTEGTHFTATGVPAGLTLTVTRTSQSAAQIAFTGAAQAHENINDASVVLTFLNAAVVSGNAGAVTGLTPKTLTIDFADAPVVVNAPSAAYSGTMFAEAGANNGTVTTIRTVTLAFDTFVPTGAFTQGVHFTATGVPAGLTLAINRTSSEIAQISFTGAASAHENINDATVSLTFLNAAVASGNAAAVTGLTPKTLTIDFADTQALSSAVYSDSTFIESAINNGSVITVNTLTLNGASFVNVTTLTQGVHYTATGVPAGLSLVITRTGSSTAQVSFIGTATAHANTNDATVMLTFLNAVLVSGNASSISGLTPKRLFVDFADPTCGAVTTLAGNGNASVIDGAGLSASFADPRDVVTDAAGNIYVADKYCIRKITPSGVVTILAGSATASGFVNAIGTAARFSDIYGIGIDAVGNIYAADYANACVRKITPTGVVTTVAGGNGAGFTNGPSASATFFAPHDVAADALGNLYVADLGNNAIRKISNGVVTTLSAGAISHGPINLVVDQAGNVYVGGYGENKVYKITPTGTVSVLAGSGALGNTNGTGAGATFGQPTGVTLDSQGNLYVADYYPYSLIRKITPAGVVTTLAGNGSSGYADGTGTSAAFNYPWGLALDASGNLFIGDRFNQRIRSIYVCGASGQFPLAATYTGTVFPEAIANNGTITTTQTVTLGGTTWSSAIADGSGLVAGAHYTVSGVPAGLTLQITRTSPTSAVIAFIGAATAHANLNDASVVITFLDAAVANGAASAVAGLTPKTLTIDFNDPPIGASAVYSDVVFPEIQANNGQITTTRTVTLTNASFVSGTFVNGTHFTASGVPDGLTLAVTRLSATQARLAFTGTASAHALANSTDVVLTFLPAVLTGGNVGAVADLTPKTLRVNFLDPYTASYSDTTFAESVANDGSVPTTRTVTLLGTTFTTLATTFVQGTHFNASGVPAGLTLTVTKLSPTVAQIAFSGSALAHVNDVNNITLTFLNAALESGSGTAAAVIGLTPKKLSIDFIAPYSATYSAKNFVEGPANDGSVPTTRLISLFGGDAWLPTTLLQGAHFTATGVPAGLTIVMTRTSSTGAQISFTGSATNHANINDASVSITFLPEALVSGNPSAVVGLTPATLTIDFRDPDVAPPSSPNILGFTPQVGTTGTVVTISGFGFTGTQNVLFGGAPAKSLTVVSDSVLTAVVDYGSTGDVTVVNAQGLAILPGFTYVPRPTISSFTPTTGNAGAVVTINGANFQGTALNGTQWTTSSVYFGGTPATSFTVISPTQIQATVGAGATGAVRVETLPGNVGVRNGFCYMAPLIAAFAPTSASTGTQVVITGSNFTGATAVKFNGKAAASFVVVSDTEITAFPATGTPLTGSISVTTPQCTDDLATFTFIPAPIIYGFWLSGGTDGDVITIDGINFTGATGVKFGDMVAASYTVVSPTRIQAVVGSGNTGAVTVIGPGGVGSRSKFIYYAPGAGRPNPPIITSFTPTEGPDGTVITITGLNFQGTDWYTTAVRIGDAPPITGIIQSMTPTQLKVKVNGGNSGKITVYTPAGVTTSTMSFTYFPAPTISAFTPTTGAAGTTVTILGTEFTGVTSVKVGSANATSFTVDSPTQITAVVGTGTTGRVQVVASGGTATSSLNFTFPTPPPSPTLTTFSPAIATTGTVVTINGSNFTGATQVTFGGTPAQSFTVVNASRITAVVGAGASGSVAVITPSGTASKTGFTYLPNPLPTITSFSPASASPGQTVTILGTYFTGATQVFMGSASVPFTVIHSGKITVEVPSNAASGVIRVVTPNGVAMRSGFTVLPIFAAPPVPGIVAEKVGVQESMSVGVYPNPANESVTVTGTGFGDGRTVNLVVMNTLGQTVLVLTGQSIGGTLQANVDVRDLPSGAYTVALSDGVLKQALRFVKR